MIKQEPQTLPPDGRPAAEQPRWRRDFPIDWPQDHYVARRDFTKFMVLTSLAFAIGQCWIVVRNFWGKRRGTMPVQQIARVEQIPLGGALTFAYPEEKDRCVLVHTDEQTFVAFSQECTHLSCAVVPEPEKGRFHCPCHAGSFDLTTGRPTAGPPRRPLARIILEVRQGAIYATGVERQMV